jgi:hypothetical protein
MVWIMMGVTVLITVASLVALRRTYRTRLYFIEVVPAFAAAIAALVAIGLFGLWVSYSPGHPAPEPATVSYPTTLSYLANHKVTAVYVDTVSFAADQVGGELAYLHLHNNHWTTGVIPAGSTDDLAAEVVAGHVSVLDSPPPALYAAWQRYDDGPSDPRSTTGMLWAFDSFAAAGILAYLVADELRRRRALLALEQSLATSLSDPQSTK